MTSRTPEELPSRRARALQLVTVGDRAMRETRAAEVPLGARTIGVEQGCGARATERGSPSVVAVFDGDPSSREAIVDALRAEPVCVLELLDGAELAALLARLATGSSSVRPDLLVADLAIPGLGGRDALAELLAKPWVPPLVVLADPDDVALQQVALSAGAAVCLRRPLEIAALLRALRRILAFR